MPNMATWDDVRRIAVGLPQTSETTSHEGHSVWTVKQQGSVQERSLGRADFVALGNAAPDGPILCARVADEGVNQAFLADRPDG